MVTNPLIFIKAHFLKETFPKFGHVTALWRHCRPSTFKCLKSGYFTILVLFYFFNIITYCFLLVNHGPESGLSRSKLTYLLLKFEKHFLISVALILTANLIGRFPISGRKEIDVTGKYFLYLFTGWVSNITNTVCVYVCGVWGMGGGVTAHYMRVYHLLIP